MGLLARRFLVLAALMFWQGGFTFYAAVVVPVGRHVIGRRQSEVTPPVTAYLNLAGAVALAPLAWDVSRCRDNVRRRRRLRWLAWAGMALTLCALLGLHKALSGRLHPGLVASDPSFRNLHRLYLWVSTVQWACSLVYAGLMLLAWRAEDQLRVPGNEVQPGSTDAEAGEKG
jgi:hypothetical protein